MFEQNKRQHDQKFFDLHVQIWFDGLGLDDVVEGRTGRDLDVLLLGVSGEKDGSIKQNMGYKDKKK